jgi:hypothetical protein
MLDKCRAPTKPTGQCCQVPVMDMRHLVMSLSERKQGGSGHNDQALSGEQRQVSGGSPGRGLIRDTSRAVFQVQHSRADGSRARAAGALGTLVPTTPNLHASSSTHLISSFFILFIS